MTGSLSHAHRHGIPAGGILCREKDLPDILRDIRDTHRKDAITADESWAALKVQRQLQDTKDYKSNVEEKEAPLFPCNSHCQ